MAKSGLAAGIEQPSGSKTVAYQFQTLPDATDLSAALKEQLARQYQQRGKEYHPRIRHLQEEGSAKYTNGLFLDASPLPAAAHS